MNCLRHLILPVAVLYSVPSLSAQNDIQVLGDAVFTPAELAEGAFATYLIRFQNIGTDTAYQVILRDTLDPRLDMASFEMLGQSHNAQLIRDGSTIVRWYFDNISLPDSASGGPASIGFVLFAIKPKSFLSPGQTILNRSCATFNQTMVTCTNEAIIWIDANAGIDEPEKLSSLQIVPNPNHGNFEVRSTNATVTPADPEQPAAEWWITDISGKIVWDGHAEDVASASVQVWLEKPAPGLYLLWVKDDKQLQVKQFAIVR
ncbi:MAG: T9SS type A sorting domain-containing protein [Saprospirales bacterium]|nr:T9SS type A sorting domain-containing protein [Saprospirales bacterium]MBK8922285.1 T9SS type A sorting domain-containing protein [Saprospirales bacterium]